MYREVREKAVARHTGRISFKSDGNTPSAARAGSRGRDGRRRGALRRKAAAFLQKGPAKNFQKVEAVGTRTGRQRIQRGIGTQLRGVQGTAKTYVPPERVQPRRDSAAEADDGSVGSGGSGMRSTVRRSPCTCRRPRRAVRVSYGGRSPTSRAW